MSTKPYIAQQTVNDFGQVFSNQYWTASLAATTDTTLTVPGDAPRYKAVIKVKPASVVYIALNATAAVPAGTTFAASTSELLCASQTTCREVKAADVLHFYTATGSTDVSVVFYAIGSTAGL